VTIFACFQITEAKIPHSHTNAKSVAIVPVLFLCQFLCVSQVKTPLGFEFFALAVRDHMTAIDVEVARAGNAFVLLSRCSPKVEMLPNPVGQASSKEQVDAAFVRLSGSKPSSGTMLALAVHCPAFRVRHQLGLMCARFAVLWLAKTIETMLK